MTPIKLINLLSQHTKIPKDKVKILVNEICLLEATDRIEAYEDETAWSLSHTSSIFEALEQGIAKHLVRYLTQLPKPEQSSSKTKEKLT